VLKSRPDLVVLQFGTTDVGFNLGHRIRSRFARILNPGRPARGESKKPQKLDPNQGAFRSSLIDDIFGRLKLSLCRLARIEPMHGGKDIYLKAMGEIMDAIVGAGAVPVVLSPFPHGDRTCHLWAGVFSQALKELTDSKGGIFVDALTALESVPKSEILLEDKFHLSRQGHRLLGERLALSLIEHHMHCVNKTAKPKVTDFILYEAA